MKPERAAKTNAAPEPPAGRGAETDRDQLPSQDELDTIRGQEPVKRALEVAAAGGHPIVLSGPPGAGKTLLARALASLLPPLLEPEARELTALYRAGGVLPPEAPLLRERPVRMPPAAIDAAGLIGDEGRAQLGEVQLAQGGVLLLDDLPAFDQRVVEGLYSSLAEGAVRRIGRSDRAPDRAHVLLVATMRPCPCGWVNEPAHPCTCSKAALTSYQKRLSRCFLACFELCIEVPRSAYEYLNGTRRTETSAAIRTRVAAAHASQEERFRGTAIHCNAEMGPAEISALCKVEPAAEQLLNAAIQPLHLTTERTQHIQRVARTIADLAGVEGVAVNHVAEAIWYCRTAGRDL